MTEFESEKPDLSTVNSRLALSILHKVKVIPIKAKAKAEPADLLEAKLKRYEEIVNSKVEELRNKTAVNLVFLTLTLIFLILASVYSNLASLVSSVGLGATSIVAQGTSWKDTVISYFNDSGKLKRRVKYLRALYEGCDKSNAGELKKISDQIDQDFNELDKAIAP